MKQDSSLIYDVGVNNGDDTAYYLFKGYNVLGIEADPTFTEPLRKRFAAEIATGRFTLLNVALAPESGTATFWICEGYSLWNSFDRDVASRNGRKSHSIELECWPLRKMFEKFGVPVYLKLSLHGQEHFCLVDIDLATAPIHISLELPREIAIFEEIIDRLTALGYLGFKIIDQTSQHQLVISPRTLKSRLRNQLRRYPHVFRACESLIEWVRHIFGSSGSPENMSSSNFGNSLTRWSFPIGSSGPFGDESHGKWNDEDKTRSDWRAFISGKTSLGKPGLLIWYDLHATRTN